MTPAMAALRALPGARFVRLARREKRPLGRSWPTLATGDMDAVEAWFRAGSNVGLLLGEASGLVDVEFDDDDGRRTASALKLDSIDTPRWRSSRGEHRLFRWSPVLPAAGWAVVGGLEVRIGGRPAQSVLPPSIHPGGEAYVWLRSPLDCPVAELPEQLLSEVCR